LGRRRPKPLPTLHQQDSQSQSLPTLTYQLRLNVVNIYWYHINITYYHSRIIILVIKYVTYIFMMPSYNLPLYINHHNCLDASPMPVIVIIPIASQLGHMFLISNGVKLWVLLNGFHCQNSWVIFCPFLPSFYLVLVLKCKVIFIITSIIIVKIIWLVTLVL
jgi:hypothetical protein